MNRACPRILLPVLLTALSLTLMSCTKKAARVDALEPQAPQAEPVVEILEESVTDTTQALVSEEELLAAEEQRRLEEETRLAERRRESIDALRPVYFDFDRYNLREDARLGLNRNADLLGEVPDLKLRIEGHCDENGSVAYNLALGDRRALAARDYLVNLGIAQERLETVSYGKARPAVQGSNEAAWSKNRRCEFRPLGE